MTPETLTKYLKIFGVVIFSYFAYRQGKKIIETIKIANKQKNLNTTATASTGQTYDLGKAAAEIYDCFYNNDWFGWTEDETRAINVLNSIPAELYSNLEQTYYKLYQKNLKEDFIKYVSPSDLTGIQIF